MSFTATLFRDNILSSQNKYRAPIDITPIVTVTNVNNSNFSNKNLFCDNSVDINCSYMGTTPPPVVEPILVPSYDAAAKATHIKIEWSDYIVIGHIIDWEYINDNNTRIAYVVDAYTSARASAMITDMKGICQRTNLFFNDSYFVNMQPEPFSPSDVSQFNPDITETANNNIKAFETLIPGNGGTTSNYNAWVLTVSPAIIKFLGDVPPFFAPVGGSYPPELKTVDDFDFTGNDTTAHSGGVYRGTPLRFTSWNNLQAFIRNILSGCGFRKQMPADGFSTQKLKTNMATLFNSNVGGAQQGVFHRNWNEDPIESVRFITGEDLYSLYSIPQQWAGNQDGYFESDTTISGFKIPMTLHQFGQENNVKNKLCGYPYKYYKLLTANGDNVTIYPQTHFTESGEPFKPSISVGLNLRYIGGDSPRLMGRLVPKKDTTGNKYGMNASNEWFTIRSYPAVTLSFNNSYNPQIQRDVGNVRKLNAMYANAVANARVESAFKQGYRDTVRGGFGGDVNRGAYDAIKYGLGGILGVPGRIGNEIGAALGQGTAGGQLFSDTDSLAISNEIRSISAGNFISPEIGVVMGNDFQAQMGVQAIAVFECGATDAELFSFARYLDEFGQACNCVLNPVTNAGDIFGGYAAVMAVDDRTFYQFSNISITGFMPFEWKVKIKELFETGVYLYDS